MKPAATLPHILLNVCDFLLIIPFSSDQVPLLEWNYGKIAYVRVSLPVSLM
jgi:hypothetical protein